MCYIFHHIPKCGGTSIKSLLKKWFITVDDYRKEWTMEYPEKIDLKSLTPDHCLCGHFELDGYYLYQRYPQVLSNTTIKLFSFVRDPLQIQLSLFRYEMAHGVNKSNNIIDHLNLRRNYLANRFPVNENNYKNVIDRYFFIGILEYVQASVDILSYILKKDCYDIPWINKTEKEKHDVFLASDVINEFKMHNSLDYKVYNYCLEKFKSSLSEYKKCKIQNLALNNAHSNKQYSLIHDKEYIKPDNFLMFRYAHKKHFEVFEDLDIELYGNKVDPSKNVLKKYQDLLVLSFIKNNVPKGARLLEVGGGNSRILAHLAKEYECWNVDKFEGLGNGPRIARQAGYKVILDYMGNNNPKLQNDYFDFVFSISALEHTPEDPALHARILEDMNRVLKPGCFSLHLFDVVFKPKDFWTNPFLPYLFQNASPLFPMPDPEAMQNDPDLYVMSKEAYDRGWKKITGKTYEEFGQPTSINILWSKALKSLETEPSESLLHSNKITDAKPGPEVLIRSTLPVISIVTPSFNQGEFLEECIDSILSQGYPNLEYVIMDGGSTDGSVEIIKRYEKHLKYWQSRKDNGQYWAVNEGFKHTSGEIMAWLNSDDVYHPGSLSLISELFRSNNNYQWITGIPNHIDKDSNPSWIIKEIPKYSRFKYLCKEFTKPFIQQEGTFWKRSLWNKAGGYLDERFDFAGDLELWVRFFRYDVIYVVVKAIGSYRNHGNQKAQLFFDKYMKEASIIIENEINQYSLRKFSFIPLPPNPIVV